MEPFWFCDEARPKTSARRVTRKAAKDTRRMAMTTTSTGTFLPVPGPSILYQHVEICVKCLGVDLGSSLGPSSLTGGLQFATAVGV
jgi:hypothetical protein